MPKKNPNPEATKHFTPLNPDLVGRIATRSLASNSEHPTLTPSPTELSREPALPATPPPAASRQTPEHSSAPDDPPRLREPLQRIRFDLPAVDYEQLLDCFRDIQRVLGPFDITNFLRASVTRAITARQELIEAARAYAERHGKLKRPNSRAPSEVASIDHALFEIQASALRRAPRPALGGEGSS